MNAIQLTQKYFSGKTVAVVGNAPTAGSGPRDVDGFDVVVRFNHFRVGPSFMKVGKRTDVIGVPTACLWAITPQEQMMNVPLFIDAAPAKEGDYEKGLQRIIAASPDAEIIEIPPSFHRKLAKELGGVRATTGLATVAWLLKWSKSTEIYLTGFSCLKGTLDHYYDDRVNRFNYNVHCPVKEGFWLANHHAGLSWDTHMSAVLESGQPCDEVANAEKRSWRDYSEPHQRVYRTIASKIASGSSVIEVGGGIGWGAGVLKQAGADVGLIVEPHPRSRQHLDTQGWRTVEGMDDVTEHFETAVCVEVLEHLPATEIHGFLSSIRAVSRRGFFSTPDRRRSSHGRRTELEWKTAFILAGWKVVSVEEIKWTTLFDVVAN